MFSKLLFLSLFILFIANPKAQACTAFCFCENKEKILVAKNYDWYIGHDHGAVFTNARGCERSALNLNNTPNPAKWTAKYGSVTLTQFGRGFPIGGMNEKGLVIEMEQLEESQYNDHQVEKPFVNEAQWTQYQLDNYASVDEVLANLDKIRVVQAYTGIHYFLTDATGKTAVVEYLGGKAHVYTQQNLPWSVLANDTYQDAVKYLKANPDQEVPAPLWDRTSERRFQTAARRLVEFRQVPVDQWLQLNWDILNSSRMRISYQPSQWGVIYDISTGEVHFRMWGDDRLKSFNIKNLDLDNKRGKMLDMNIESEGNVESKFVDYSDDFNKELINSNRWLLDSSVRKAGIDHARQECR